MYWRPNSFATFGTTSRIIVKMLISDWLLNFKINLVTLLIGCQWVNSVTLGRPNCLTYIGNFWLRKTSAIYLSLLTKPFLKWHSTHPPDHRHLCPFQSLYKYRPLSHVSLPYVKALWTTTLYMCNRAIISFPPNFLFKNHWCSDSQKYVLATLELGGLTLLGLYCSFEELWSYFVSLNFVCFILVNVLIYL